MAGTAIAPPTESQFLPAAAAPVALGLSAQSAPRANVAAIGCCSLALLHVGLHHGSAPRPFHVNRSGTLCADRDACGRQAFV